MGIVVGRLPGRGHSITLRQGELGCLRNVEETLFFFCVIL